MAIKSNSDEVGPAPSESFYEERASEEEIYLEETEEELRSRLISDTPQDDRPTPAPETLSCPANTFSAQCCIGRLL